MPRDSVMNGFHVWDGIQAAFPDADPPSRVWESQQWLETLTRGLTVPEASGHTPFAIPPTTLIHDYPLPPVVALLAAAASAAAPLRVLDFGGGLGQIGFACLQSLPWPERLEWHIVEDPAVCERGQAVAAGWENVYFHPAWPTQTEQFDIVHIAAALHYLRDWRAALQRLTAYAPRVVMLNALNAGAIPTFVSFQNYYGHRLPVWFWNLREIVDYVQALGYTLTYKSLLEFTFLGKLQPLPMDNFPPEYRLERKCNLMFVPEQTPC